MSISAFSEGILKFITEIDENVMGIDNAVEDMCRIMELVADEVGLGRLILSLDAPPNNFEPEGVKKYKKVTFSPDVNEEDCIYRRYVTPEGGIMEMTFLPRTGCSWDEKERALICVLAKLFFIFSGRIRVMDLLNKSIYTDSRTGAANTQAIMRFGGMLKARGQLVDYAIVYINIKNFKFVNQLFGNPEGDMLLKKFSEAMKNFVDPDGFFARLGGDNFIMLLKKGRITDLRGFADALSFEMGEGDAKQLYDVRLRMGICEATESDTMSDLMSKATVAYGATKQENMDVVYYTPILMEASMHRKEISTIFPKALENREFAVYYQPKVRLSDNRLCGCEALCRWIKNGRIVPPMDFIPVLEAEGTICRLDFYIFERVCEDLKRWKEMGIEPVKVSVNFSKHHLRNRRLADEVLGIIRKHGVDGKYIEIELTEMTGAEDFTAMNVFIEKMKENNISTSIDDFGTGYSSLNLLKDLDVDVIKLDKSFFTNINEGDGGVSTDRIVVKNIVNMVNELNMETISEGVETAAQADFLRDINCNMVQGFLFDKPLPRDEFEVRLINGDFYQNR
ncbi:MAG: bifunctional diguanylate cyclase/phosphodiesterase [Oscillospiraceae bacterium]|nr:bifunctional diguanylate cyclase/phosphodiesterase [Oscillospiraceae bacterium]